MNAAGGAPEDPLYRRDPGAWYAHLAEGNRTQPRKRVAAQSIIHDGAGRLLLVDPSYKPDWDLPGGMVEANEPPADAARRELREELGLEIELHGLLCVDWVEPHGPWDDLLVFVFDGGTLTAEQAAELTPTDGELADFAFFAYPQAQERLRDYVWQRTRAALASKQTPSRVYLHGGQEA
ncbi:hypothetical protein GCM10023224_15920 [Streptomonospora halophila]|uniref:Nudix hydrolase domain-containing protein n=1 Tax=Streptomonospora halophila TaxID=427369 RepID=A0ABP9GJJ8_9ACTN